MPRIGLIHSTRFVIEPVHTVVSAGCPEVEIIHIMDEGLLPALWKYGEITDQITQWLANLIRPLEQEEGHLAVVTCSSLSPCVNSVREMLKMPVLKIDEPMVEYAVTNADSIGVVMTNPSTVKPSTMLIEEVSQRLGKSVEIMPKICEGAFKKLNAGDVQGHDDVVVQS